MENSAAGAEKWVDEPRIDAREKVTGAARYVEDLPDLPGMIYEADLLEDFPGQIPGGSARLLYSQNFASEI